MPFVHLHTHSHYSLLDGLGTIQNLVAEAKRKKMEALALTDHGVMYGLIEFYQECRKHDIKPILGVEGYLTDGKMSDQDRNLKKSASMATSVLSRLILLKRSCI